MGFRPTRYDQDLWIRKRADKGYDYVGKHTDDIMIVSPEPMAIWKILKETYERTKVGPPKFHLGRDYEKMEDGRWRIGTKTHTLEALQKAEE
jgi:hypothetical protein